MTAEERAGAAKLKLEVMAELCKEALKDCMKPNNVQAELLKRAIRLVDPNWKGL